MTQQTAPPTPPASLTESQRVGAIQQDFFALPDAEQAKAIERLSGSDGAGGDYLKLPKPEREKVAARLLAKQFPNPDNKPAGFFGGMLETVGLDPNHPLKQIKEVIPTIVHQPRASLEALGEEAKGLVTGLKGDLKLAANAYNPEGTMAILNERMQAHTPPGTTPPHPAAALLGEAIPLGMGGALARYGETGNTSEALGMGAGTLLPMILGEATRFTAAPKVPTGVRIAGEPFPTTVGMRAGEGTLANKFEGPLAHFPLAGSPLVKVEAQQQVAFKDLVDKITSDVAGMGRGDPANFITKVGEASDAFKARGGAVYKNIAIELENSRNSRGMLIGIVVDDPKTGKPIIVSPDRAYNQFQAERSELSTDLAQANDAARGGNLDAPKRAREIYTQLQAKDAQLDEIFKKVNRPDLAAAQARARALYAQGSALKDMQREFEASTKGLVEGKQPEGLAKPKPQRVQSDQLLEALKKDEPRLNQAFGPDGARSIQQALSVMRTRSKQPWIRVSEIVSLVPGGIMALAGHPAAGALTAVSTETALWFVSKALATTEGQQRVYQWLAAPLDRPEVRASLAASVMQSAVENIQAQERARGHVAPPAPPASLTGGRGGRGPVQ